MRFITDAGREVPSITAAQMAGIDRIAINECGPNFYQMMEDRHSHRRLPAGGDCYEDPFQGSPLVPLQTVL